MMKYVTFAFLIVFSVPAVLGDGPKNISVVSDVPVNDSVTTESAALNTTVSATPVPTTTAPTTEAPTTPESTTNKVTTAPPPSTTALPPPDIGKYTIPASDKNETCLRVEMALRISVHDLHSSYNFPPNASTSGSSCNVSNTQVLNLTAPDLKHTLTLVFVQEDKRNYVKDIMFTYYTTEMKTVNTSGHFFPANEGNSYLCHSDEEIKIENVTLTFSSVHVQAFGADKFGRAEECNADDKVGDIVPIAVGCALGALVIIVLIAYLVGRRRSHQKGYQSV